MGVPPPTDCLPACLPAPVLRRSSNTLTSTLHCHARDAPSTNTRGKTTVSLTQQTTADKNTVSRQREDSRWISLQEAPANMLRVPHRPPVHCDSQPAGCGVTVQVRAAPLPLCFCRSLDRSRLSSFSVNSPNVTVQTLSPRLLRQRHPRDRQNASQWLHLDRPCFHGNREESAPRHTGIKWEDFRDHSLIKRKKTKEANSLWEITTRHCRNMAVLDVSGILTAVQTQANKMHFNNDEKKSVRTEKGLVITSTFFFTYIHGFYTSLLNVWLYTEVRMWENIHILNSNLQKFSVISSHIISTKLLNHEVSFFLQLNGGLMQLQTKNVAFSPHISG